MSEKSCPICLEKKVSLFIDKYEDINFKTTTEQFNLFSCSNCDAKFQSPFVSEQEVGKYYPQAAYHPFNLNKNVIQSNLKYNPQSIYLALLLKERSRDENFSLIDLGCGGGSFLMSVKSYFPNAELMGVDISETAFENLKSTGIEALRRSMYDYEINRKFDYITSSQVLEHLNHPYNYLERLATLAKEDTKIMLDIPATDSYSAIKFGRYWVHWDLPRHSIMYSKTTLKYLLRNFTTVKLQHAGSLAAFYSSYKLKRNKRVHNRSYLEILILKIATKVAKILSLNFLFSDKLVWIGKLK